MKPRGVYRLHLSRRWIVDRALAVAFVIAALMGAGAYAGVRALSSSSDSSPESGRLGVDTLDGVSLDELSRNGIHVSPPAQDTASIDADAAVRVASAFFPGVRTKQVLLAQASFDATGVAADTRDVWIISYDVSDPALRAPGQVTPMVFYVAFVDADTGQYLTAMGEGEPETPGGSHGIRGLTPGAISTPDTPNAPRTPPPAQ